MIRFAGDSGDGMQLTGGQFTATTAAVGNDLATLPDFPAEIRAPAGTLAGVSGFQIQFAAEPVFTPGDRPDALVAMNPAALKTNIGDLRPRGILIVNSDSFKETDLRKAGYAASPLDDGSLDGYRLFRVELTRLTRAAPWRRRAAAWHCCGRAVRWRRASIFGPRWRTGVRSCSLERGYWPSLRARRRHPRPYPRPHRPLRRRPPQRQTSRRHLGRRLLLRQR